MKSPIIQHASFQDLFHEKLTETEAIALIASDLETLQCFESLTPDFQQKALSFICGNTGLKILGDKFFKDIMKPKTHPERLSSMLSAILGKTVTIKSVLPTEGNKLAEGGSFVIMDILVEDEDGTTINVEIQRVGYLFPGERSCCYLSDLVMRQYNKVRSEKGKLFSYHHMKPIILIVIMENSSTSFLAAAPHYIHREKTIFDSGATITNLTQTIYISLDTFHSVVHDISTKLDAWLTFLGSDSPADIIKLINAYPEFIEYYKDIVEYRKHPKELMNMFSEALAIMDRNMEQYMIDEWKATIEKQKATIKENESIIKQNESRIKEQDSALKEKDATLREKDSTIMSLEAHNQNLQARLDEALAQIASQQSK